jgi:predicted P-loop ATPase/GTPase
MADTKTLTIRQTIRRPHHEIVRRQWSTILERTITREIAADGSIVAEEVTEEVVEQRADFVEEALETIREDDEVIAESVSDEA